MASLTSHFINAVTDNLVANISLGPIKVNALGGKSIDLQHTVTKRPVMVRLPKLKCWGVDDKEYDGKKKFTLGMAFPLKASPESDAIIANLAQLDDFVKHQAIANSKDWFNKPKMSMEVVEALYSPCLRYSKTESGELNHAKPPNFTLKIPFWNDGRCDTEVFQHDGSLAFPNGEMSIVDAIPKGANITSLVQCNGIWFAGGKFGVTFKLKQACVQLMDYLPRGVNYCDSAPTRETPRVESAFPQRTITESHVEESALAVADSDDERDPEAEYTPTDESAPVKHRKRVVKRGA